MLSEAQIQYLTEVLGTSPENYRTVGATSSPSLPTHTLVMTPSLNADQKALLDRILNSVQLSDVVYKVIDDAMSSNDESGARHVLMFTATQPAGRTLSENGQVIWGLGDLNTMLGDGPEVAQAKKAAWNLLQIFNKERLGDQ